MSLTAAPALAALLLLAILPATPGLAADARPATAASDTDPDCRDKPGTDCPARKPQEQEKRDLPRQPGGPGLLGGGNAIVPCTGSPLTGAVCGVSSELPTVTRSPLTVRRFEFSAGVDHALGKQWVLGGLLGVGRGRLHRVQTEQLPGSIDGPSIKDTAIRTRSTTAVGSLTWFANPDLAIDANLSLQRTSFDFERLDTPGGRRFFGANAGRGWGLSLAASEARRSPGIVWVPQIGLDYTDSRVDPLAASIADPPPGSLDNFRVSAQHTKTLASVLGLQVQWPRSRSFGVVIPYARTAWRQRLSQRSSPVVATAQGKPSVTVDPQTQTSRQSVVLAAGLLVQWPGGVAVFGDLGHTRGAGGLRETRLSLGIKFER